MYVNPQKIIVYLSFKELSGVFHCPIEYKFINTSIQPIDGTLSGVTTPSQSEPRSNGNRDTLCFSDSQKGNSTIRCSLVLCLGHKSA